MHFLMWYYLHSENCALICIYLIDNYIISRIRSFGVKDVARYRISDKVCQLQPHDIIFFVTEYKSSEPVNKSFGSNPFCAYGSQSVVIIQQCSVLFYPSTLYIDL